MNYFKAEEKHGWNLFGGIVTLILALALFSGSFIEMVTFVPFIISFWALTNGITKTIVGFKVRGVDKSVGTPLLALGILGIIAGLVMMAHTVDVDRFFDQLHNCLCLYLSRDCGDCSILQNEIMKDAKSALLVGRLW